MPSRNPERSLTVDDLTVIVQTKRVKNINLRVRPDGTVHVSAPAHTSDARIEQVVRSHAHWIRQARTRLQAQADIHQTPCDQGELVYVWGKPLTVSLVSVPSSSSRPTCGFEMSGTKLVVRASADLARDTREARELREERLRRWLRTVLLEEADTMLPHCSATVGRECSALRLRRMTSRWGSCNVRSGVVTLNTQLVHHRRECLEYVITHELCHLHEPSHNARFHALMDQFYPAWRPIRAELNGR